MQITDVEKLAELARIEMPEAEKESILTDLTAVLSYIDQIQKVSVEESYVEPDLRNIMREDTGAHQVGLYTEKILAEAPEVSDGYIKVQSIL